MIGFNCYSMTLAEQMAWLFILAIPVASIAWTITHEEVFREPREFCTRHSVRGKWFVTRKFFYLFTCEYCFSHYVTIIMLFISRFHLLFNDWRGYLVAGFSLVWVANIYMSLFGKIRVDIKKNRTDISLKEEQKKKLGE